MPLHVLAEAVRSGRLRRILPEVYAERVDSWEDKARAAIRYVEGRGALSHTSALRLWRLPAPEAGPIHLTVSADSGFRSRAGVRVHRHHGFGPEHFWYRGGLPVTRLETAVVESWPWLNRDLQRAPAIRAVAERLTTPGRLSAALRERPRLGGRRVLAELVAKLETGCRSELEIWGHDHVFRDFPGIQWQVPVRIQHRTVYLDVFHPETRTNFELDGARYHTDRERDLRRDAALSATGITVVRFTHERLVSAVGDVRSQVAAIVSVRSTGGGR
jgi:very-short-patch-repair endonuclease